MVASTDTLFVSYGRVLPFPGDDKSDFSVRFKRGKLSVLYMDDVQMDMLSISEVDELIAALQSARGYMRAYEGVENADTPA